MKKILSIFLALTFVLSLLTGCSKNNSKGNNDSNSKTNSEVVSERNDDNSSESDEKPVGVDFFKTDADMFTERDFKTEYDESDAVIVKLNGTSATASSSGVKISGSTITITEDKTHIISGSLDNGMIIVDVDETAKVQLVFNGVNITNESSAALYVMEADKVFVTLADGTTNNLANSGTFTAIDDNNIDGTVFSKQDLTLNGLGTLTVTSPVGNGIVCKDDLVITSGTYVVNSASHGLDANDSVRIINADLTIDAGKDAIHSENADDDSLGFVYIASGSIKGEAEGDGIVAGAYMQIVDGTINLFVGGGSANGMKEHSDSFGGFMGEGRPGYPRSSNTKTTDENSTSMKGLKAANNVVICGGKITIDSADDSIHSDVSVIINGGTFVLTSGDDAIHAEDTLTITTGNIDIAQSYEGLEALHIDIQGGNIRLVANDDGLNAAGGTDSSGTTGGRDGMFGGGMSLNSNGSITISGGTLYINSSGDGMDANGILEISGGYITVVGPTQGDTATLDYDKSAIITGGTFIGTGASGMAQSFSDSEQGIVAINVGNQLAGTEIVLKDSVGNILISHKPELSFAIVILSSPDIVKGETYSITVGLQSGEFEAN